MEQKQMSTKYLLKRFYPYFKPYWHILVFDLFCASLTSVCDLVLPVIVRFITNTVTASPADLTVELVVKITLLYIILRIIDVAANYYMQHNDESLDEPITYDDDEEDPRTRVDNVRASLCMSADWNVRYYDLLEDLKRRAEDRQCGFSRLTDDFYQTMENGGDTAYFARKNRLNEKQMKRFLTILREEAKALRTAA